MNDIIRIGVDTSKSVFQLHGVDAAERPVLRKRLRRRDFLSFFGKLPPTEVGLEACGGAHYWARELMALGHEPKLLPAQHVKPYVQRNKNDKQDADAICEAMSRPRMSFVRVKSVEEQAAQMLMTMRQRLIDYRTQLINTIRGHAAEFGLAAAKGPAHVEPLLTRIAEDGTVPALAKELFAIHGQEYDRLRGELREIEAKLKAWHRQNEMSRRLAEVDAIGPIGGCLLTIKAPNPQVFRCGRDFAAWMGLTPKDHSTAGKMRLGVITRAGDESLRRTLVVGATSVIKQVRKGKAHPSPWLRDLVARKPPKLAAVALANKVARIAWKLMVSGERYDAARAGIVSPRPSVAPCSPRQGRCAPPAAVAFGQP
ncbi:MULTISPECIES: IS110 family transposase [unclassified Bradyrhizobium]|uniref:IS110 family transposase n=1 Tax=unclassified Bradyrhizobium TaxID=2631580 RepID=UPI002FEE8352